MLEWILFIGGGFFCLLNFYLSFLRYPLHKLKGGSRDSYRWVSGIPLVGSLSVAVSLLVLHEVRWMLASGIVLIFMDTGGIHWFTGTMLARWVSGKRM
jgi:uncharacterized membrane protein